MNKFAENYSNYPRICYDFFSSISKEMSEKLKIQENCKSSHIFVANLTKNFKAMEGEKYMFSEKFSGLILLHTFGLI